LKLVVFRFHQYMQIRQWVEVHGIERPEYEPELDDLMEVSPDEKPSELQNKCAMLHNALVSAQYQLNNLNNSVIAQETRINFTKKVIESALNLIQEIQSQV
jgi:hypothetical protein